MACIRLSELEGKEVINLADGARLGVIGDADIVINADSGEIQSIILPQKSTVFGLWADRQQVIIPWHAVKKIGNEVVIVDLDQTVPNFSRFPG